MYKTIGKKINTNRPSNGLEDTVYSRPSRTFYQKTHTQIIETKQDRLNFGKYKGYKIKNVHIIDKQYLEWCLRNGYLRYK